MSRRITIKSSTEILELDLAEEVVNELRVKGAHHLRFDARVRVFTNQQYDDVADDTIRRAEDLYGLKLQQRHADKLEDKLKKGRYTVEKIVQGNKIKLVAKQRVYV